jgi:hypothetical protein
MTAQRATKSTLRQMPRDLDTEDKPVKLGRPFSTTNPDMTKQERQKALKNNMSDVYKEYAAFWHKCYTSRPEIKEKRAEYARNQRLRAKLARAT